MKRLFAGAVAIVLLGAPCVVGCAKAPAGPQRYQVSGTVMYRGKPVPAGEIIFTPDSSQGNSGPGAVAVIREGQYTTRAGKGVTPGPTIVSLSGFDGAPNSESLSGNELFVPYQTTITLDAKNSTHDFVVESNSK